MITKLETEAIKLYKDSKFYVAIAIPYLTLLIDAIHNGIDHVADTSNPLFILLVKGAGLLTGIYTAAKAYENGQIFQAPAPVNATTQQVGPSGIPVQ